MIWPVRDSNSSKLEGAVVHGGGEAEAVVDEVLLAASGRRATCRGAAGR